MTVSSSSMVLHQGSEAMMASAMEAGSWTDRALSPLPLAKER